MNFLPMQFYPDQHRLMWVEWSDAVLSKQHEARYSVPTGFQDFLGSDTSNNRTRALEFFKLGLLRGRLVNRQANQRGRMPVGWALVQSDQHPHSRLGHLAYAIGKAFAVTSHVPASVSAAYDALCTVFLLEIGTHYGDRYILTSSLFRYLLDRFQPSQPVPGDHRWRRKLAAAMFCTLQDNSLALHLLDRYLAGTDPTRLYLVYPHSSKTVSPDELWASDIANVRPARKHYYWAGSSATASRALYTRGSHLGDGVLDHAARLERYAIDSGVSSPFDGLLEENATQAVDCVLEQLHDIFSEDVAGRREWEKLMKTLYEGALDALRFIEDRSSTPLTRVFYAHDPDDEITQPQQLTLVVAKNACYTRPDGHDIVDLAGVRYRVLNVGDHGADLRIDVEPVK